MNIKYKEQDSSSQREIKCELWNLHYYEKGLASQCVNDKKFSCARLILRDGDTGFSLDVAEHYKTKNKHKIRTILRLIREMKEEELETVSNKK